MAFSIGPAGAFVGDMGVQPPSCGSVMCVRLLRRVGEGLADRASACDTARGMRMGMRWRDALNVAAPNVDDPSGRRMDWTGLDWTFRDGTQAVLTGGSRKTTCPRRVVRHTASALLAQAKLSKLPQAQDRVWKIWSRAGRESERSQAASSGQAARRGGCSVHAAQAGWVGRWVQCTRSLVREDSRCSVAHCTALQPSRPTANYSTIANPHQLLHPSSRRR